jgi:NAD(P)-dependent dehydrogenase (short-subunit alcohol dehydrogenase family)
VQRPNDDEGVRLKKILITGADGFIGSHLTEALVRAGHDVRAFVLYNSFNSWGWLDQCDEDIRGEFDVFAGDVRDPNGVRLATKGCDAVLHLAALIGIPYSYHSPDMYVDTNIKGTLNIVQAARDRGAPAAGPVALLGQQDRCGSDRDVVLHLVQHARDDRAPVQYLRPAPVGSGRDSDNHHADR